MYKIILLLVLSLSSYSNLFRSGVGVDYNILLGSNNTFYNNGYSFHLNASTPIHEFFEVTGSFSFESWASVQNGNNRTNNYFLDNYQIELGINYMLLKKSNFENFVNFSLSHNSFNFIEYQAEGQNQFLRIERKQSPIGGSLSLGFRSFLNDYLTTEITSGFSVIPLSGNNNQNNTIIYYYIGFAIYYDFIWN